MPHFCNNLGMSDTKLLQAILDRVSSVDKKTDSLEQKMDKGFKDVNERINVLDGKLTERIDKLGLQIARLEDDAPTIEEFDKVK